LDETRRTRYITPSKAGEAAARRVRGIERIVSDDEDFADIAGIEHHGLADFARLSSA
jgi:hypothetical protein